MQRLRYLLMVGLCVVSMADTVFGAKIVASGNVIDSISGAAVSNALVLFTGIDSLSAPKDISSLKFDSTYSNTDGTFKDTISTNASILLYGATKDGYELTWNYKMFILTPTSVNLGTIKLYPTGTAPKDTFMVSGTVVDSVTLTPIGGAKVIISGMSLNMTGDTVLTASDGTFSKQAFVNRTGPRAVVTYVVQKPGYADHFGQNQPGSSKQVNLGTIKLAPGDIGVVLPQCVTRLYQQSPNAMGVFTLSGKRLYAGPTRQLDKTQLQGTGVAVVRFTQGNSNSSTKAVSVK